MAWTTPRTFVAGEVETASIFNTHLRDNLLALNGFVRKTADESVTSSAVLQNDDELALAIPAAGSYLVDLHLIASSAANAAGDLNVGFTFPAGTFYIFGLAADATLASGSISTTQFAAAAVASGAAALSLGLSTASLGIHIHALFVATASGTLQFQWSQAVSNANASTVKAGSHMIMKQVA